MQPTVPCGNGVEDELIVAVGIGALDSGVGTVVIDTEGLKPKIIVGIGEQDFRVDKSTPNSDTPFLRWET